MAIRKSVEFKGILVSYAYIRVVMPQIQIGKDRIEFSVYYMASPSDAPFMSMNFQCPYSIDGGNPIKQGYEYIKSLEEFADAEDC